MILKEYIKLVTASLIEAGIVGEATLSCCVATKVDEGEIYYVPYETGIKVTVKLDIGPRRGYYE